MVRVLVLDWHPVSRQGLVAVLRECADFEVVELGNSRAATPEEIARAQPDVVIMDLRTQPSGGADIASVLERLPPTAGVLVLTVSEEEDDLLASVRAGARGYLLKTCTVQELIDAVRIVATGSLIVSPRMASKLSGRLSTSAAGSLADGGRGLSQRERVLLQKLSLGASNKEIARDLFLSQTTVKLQLRAMLLKMRVKSRAEAVAQAVSHGDISYGAGVTGRVS